MTNKMGWIIGVMGAIIYSIIESRNGSYGSIGWDISAFLARLIGSIAVPLVVSFIISIFSKLKNFGKIFGITCVVIYVIAILGNILYES